MCGACGQGTNKQQNIGNVVQARQMRGQVQNGPGMMMVPCMMGNGMFPAAVSAPMMLCCVQGTGAQGNKAVGGMFKTVESSTEEYKSSNIKGGCCGKEVKNKKRQNCPPLNLCVPPGNKCLPSEDVKGGFSGYHSEEICHGTGERRRDLIEELKGIISEFEEKKCTGVPKSKTRNGLRELGSYEDYWMKHCQSWKPFNPKPPPISSAGVHEVRITSDYEKMKDESNEYISFVDGRAEKQVIACECAKRNGLQDQCSHPMCKPPTAECLASNPGPCCPPSLGLDNVGGDSGAGRNRQQKASQVKQYYNASQKIVQGNQDCVEYEAAFSFGSRGQQVVPDSGPAPARFSTTYREDYLNKGADVEVMARGGMQNQHINCVCDVSSANMPSGKKYLCCPENIQC